MSHLHIREASASDHAYVTALLAELGYAVPTALVADRLTRFVHDNSAEVLVAEQGGLVIGLLSISWREWLSHERPVAQIMEMVVAQGQRKRGVGKRLIARAAALASARGCELIELTTALHREDAHSFYQGLGFDRTSYRYARALSPVRS